MTTINIANLINLLGYMTGIALYALLLVMVLKHPAQSASPEDPHEHFYSRWSSNGLLLVTAVLGLLWNIGALAIYGLKGIGYVSNYPGISAISFTALGFLPAVVVHSVLRKSNRRFSNALVAAAYSFSAVAGALQFSDAIVQGSNPSLWALRLLTFGYVALLTLLFLTTRRQEGWKKAIWASALAVFAVSALHLSHHHGGSSDNWFIELTGHHASLPLVMAILYEDYRFAFADIFLKRALAFFMLVTLTFGLYTGIASPFLTERTRGGTFDARPIGVLLGLWILTALVYPWLRRGVIRFVDGIVLRRVDYSKLRSHVAQTLPALETVEEIMNETCGVLGPAVSAREIRWTQIGLDEDLSTQVSSKERVEGQSNHRALFSQSEFNIQPTENDLVTLLHGSGSECALIFIPTAEPPYYQLETGALAGGRRLLSDDLAMLEAVALMVARRIDALRVTHERCEQSLREQEINKLATEAQLRALRAQVNPHFLFNALTTIGYLVQTAPDRALETLIKLTSLLRGVLRTDNDFVALEQELQLITAYLDIERVRFEERLRVNIDVPEALLSVRVPALLIQPLVENAIKHGITPARYGGEVKIQVRVETLLTDSSKVGRDILVITVSDTGIGASEIELVRGRRRGVGLSNIEERLHCYAGNSASLRINSTLGEGTTVELRLPFAESGSSQAPLRTLEALQEKRGA